MTATVLSLERMSVAAEAEPQFRSLLADLLGRMREQPGVLWADAAPTEGSGFVVLSEWRNAADLDAWEASEDAAAWDEAVDPLLTGDRGRRRFSPVPLP